MLNATKPIGKAFMVAFTIALCSMKNWLWQPTIRRVAASLSVPVAYFFEYTF